MVLDFIEHFSQNYLELYNCGFETSNNEVYKTSWIIDSKKGNISVVF